MANPTTNYGWPMPTSSDLVTDLPADFDAFGQPVDNTLKALNPETTLGDISYRSAVSNTNTRLAIGTAGQVLAVSAGVPAWTTTADVTPLTTKGDVFTFSTEDARIGVGADGTVLTANSSEATGLEWAAPAAAGKVLQVVSATNATQASSSSSAYADTGLTATITPTLASSTILVLVSQNGCAKTTNDTSLRLKLFRGASEIAFFSNSAAENGSAAVNGIGSCSIDYVDSPATTSALTYKTQFASQANLASVRVQDGSSLSTIILMEIGA